jgi:hypothetical protein
MKFAEEYYHEIKAGTVLIFIDNSDDEFSKGAEYEVRQSDGWEVKPMTPGPGLTMKQFCNWHIKTAENPEGTDCSAHLADGRVFQCPYSSPEDIEKAKYPCSDYKPVKHLSRTSPEPMICGICNTDVEPLDAHMGYIEGKLDVYHIDCWNSHLKG